MKLQVINREGQVLGYLPVKVGMKTREGVVTRFTEKTVWTMGKDGNEKMHRAYDGCLPVVYQSSAQVGVQWK